MDAVEDRYLLEAEEAMQPRRRWHLARRALLATAAAALLVLSVSAACLAANWDKIFLDRFAPSEAVLAQSADAIQEISAAAQYDGVTLSVDQTLGDGTAFYLTLRIRFPEDVDLSDYVIPDPATGAPEGSCILPEELQIYARPLQHEDIRGMTTEEALDWLGEEGHLENMVSVESAGVDLETNTLSYLVGLSTDDEAGFRGDLSLVVGRIAAWDGEEETVLLEGPYLISWSAENRCDTYRFTLRQGGEPVGEVQLSAFGLRVRLDSSDYTSCEPLMAETAIVYRDGHEEQPYGDCAASLIRPSGALELSWQFEEIQLLDDIRAVRVGEYVCELDGGTE